MTDKDLERIRAILRRVERRSEADRLVCDAPDILYALTDETIAELQTYFCKGHEDGLDNIERELRSIEVDSLRLELAS